MASWIWLALALYAIFGLVLIVALRESFQQGQHPWLAVIFFPLWMVFIVGAAIVAGVVGVLRGRE